MLEKYECLSCGGPAKGEFCEFCLNEEISDNDERVQREDSCDS